MRRFTRSSRQSPLHRRSRASRGRQASRHTVARQFLKHRQSRVHPRTQVRQRVALLLAIVGGVFTVGLLVFHPFFQTSNLRITGLQRIDEMQFRQSVDGLLSGRKYLVFPARNYFLLSTEKIENILIEKYSLEQIAVHKRFPPALTIAVEEKVSTIVYDDGVHYSLIGEDGRHIETIQAVGVDEWRIMPLTGTASSTDQQLRVHIPQTILLKNVVGDYPVLYGLAAAQDSKPSIDPQLASLVLAWFRALRQTHTPTHYFELNSQNNLLTIHTQLGWGIRLNPDNSDPSRQLPALMRVLDDAGQVGGPTSYVDLRYPDRVFWK
jgi:cell division septal protein FtsQ